MASLRRKSDRTSVFIDSSVLIAAAISPTGSAHDLIGLALRGVIEWYVSTLVLDETQRNLARKAPEALSPFVQSLRLTLQTQIIESPEQLSAA